MFILSNLQADNYCKKEKQPSFYEKFCSKGAKAIEWCGQIFPVYLKCPSIHLLPIFFSEGGKNIFNTWKFVVIELFGETVAFIKECWYCISIGDTGPVFICLWIDTKSYRPRPDTTLVTHLCFFCVFSVISMTLYSNCHVHILLMRTMTEHSI